MRILPFLILVLGIVYSAEVLEDIPYFDVFVYVYGKQYKDDEYAYSIFRSCSYVGIVESTTCKMQNACCALKNSLE